MGGLTARKERHPDSLLVGNALEGPDKICPLQVLGFVSPKILQLLGDVEIAKLVKDVAHEPGLANGLLDVAESLGDNLLATNYTGYRTRHLAEQVVSRVDRLLARRERVGQGLHRLQSGVDGGHREHPDAVLDAGR